MEVIIVHPYFKIVCLAALGGFFINILNLIQDSKRIRSERTTKDGLYFLMWLVWPFTGGVLGFLYADSGNQIGSFLAFHIGISSPLILQSLYEKVPALSPLPENAEED